MAENTAKSLGCSGSDRRSKLRRESVHAAWRDYGILEMLLVLWGSVFRIGFHGEFDVSPLFELDLVSLGVFQSVLDPYFPIEIIRIVDGNFCLFRESRRVGLDDLAHCGRFLNLWFARHSCALLPQLRATIRGLEE